MQRTVFTISLIFLILTTGCMSAVNRAASKGNLAEFIRLIEEEHQGMKPSEKIPPLHYAVWNRHLEVVKYLLNHGVDVNISSNVLYNPTALHIASFNGDPVIVDYLISQGGMSTPGFIYIQDRDLNRYTGLQQGVTLK